MEVLEIKVPPFQPSEFAPAQARRHIEKHHSPFPNTECPKEQVHFLDFENVRCPFTFSRDPDA